MPTTESVPVVTQLFMQSNLPRTGGESQTFARKDDDDRDYPPRSRRVTAEQSILH